MHVNNFMLIIYERNLLI